MLVELPIFLFFFSYHLAGPIKTDLIVYRTCHVSLGYSKQDCNTLALGNFNGSYAKHLEKTVESTASVVIMAQTVIETLSSALFCLFIGPWSDRYGRKPLLIIILIGQTLEYFLNFGVSLLQNLCPWYLVYCSVFTFFTGGKLCLTIVAASYSSDVTNNSNRSIKLIILHTVYVLGNFCGSLFGFYVFPKIKHSLSFFIAGIVCCLALVFTMQYIQESLPNLKKKGHFHKILNLNNIHKMIRVSFKSRPQQTILLCYVLILSIIVMAYKGHHTVLLLYLRQTLQWDLEKYILYSAVSHIVSGFTALAAVYCFEKFFKVSETSTILLGCLSVAFSAYLNGIIKTDRDVYYAAFAGALGAVLSPLLHSLISKIVTKEEVATIFSFIVAIECLLGLLGPPIYVAVYNATIYTKPGVFNFISCGIAILCFIIAIIVKVMQKNENSFGFVSLEEL